MLLILRSGCTQSARSFLSQNFPQICNNFEPFTKTSSVCANTNWASTSWAPCAEVENSLLFWEMSFLRFPKKYNCVFWIFLFSPVSVLRHWANAARSVTDSRGSIPSRPPASCCPGLPSFYVIVSVLFLTRTSARHSACCTRLLLHTLCLLA